MSGEKVICRRVSDGVLINIPHTFDLKQIADSGQCFRLTALQDGGYVAITGMKLVKITPGTNGGYVFYCPYDEFRDVWMPYFDLSADYEAYQQKMAGDPFLREAIAAGGGIRILKQDLWEMVVTFIISQRNNIPRIRKSGRCSLPDVRYAAGGDRRSAVLFLPDAGAAERSGSVTGIAGLS